MAGAAKLPTSNDLYEANSAPTNEVASQSESVPKPAWDKDKLMRASIHAWIPGKSVALVTVDDSNTTEPAYWVAGSIFSSVLGLRTHYQPEVGSEVLMLRSENKNENYIIGSLAHATGDAGSLRDQDSPTLDDTPAQTTVETDTGYDQKGDPTARMDRAGGEFDLMNAQSVGMSFLQNLVRLRASELSMIECHLMDDLVRIVSDNFQHVNAFGEYTIKNDGGRPTVVWKGSGKLYETEGREKPNDEMDDPDDWLETKARSRFQSYVGHLGNMVHVFVTEPQDTLNAIAGGRFRAHVNEDGSFLLQSFGDIAFEKTFAIQVPVQKFLEEDPEGDQLADMEYTPHAALQDWVPGDEEFFYESYKLRDYARWLNNWYSLAQYHRSAKDYDVPTEQEAQDALSKDLNGDPERPNTGLDDAHAFYIQVYSTIRIFKDGSILLYDGYSSSVHMAGGNVTISAAKNLNLEAAGDVNVTAGRDMTVKAYRHFDLAALTGGITMRAKRWFRAVSERAEMLLESLASQATIDEEYSDLDAVDRPKAALTVRSVYHRVRVLSFSELVLSATNSILLKAQGILYRGLGLRMESEGDTPEPYFAATPLGTATTSVRTDGIVDCPQVRVSSTIPIPRTNGLISGVIPAGSNPQDTADIYTSIDDQVEGSGDVAGEPSNFPSGDPEFKHHDDMVDAPRFRSVTQSELHKGTPPTITGISYSSILPSDLQFRFDGGAVSPGKGAQEKDYDAENGALHTPGSNNEHGNSGNIMVDKDWSFRRINDV